MERPTLYCEQNIFSEEPYQKIGKLKILKNGFPPSLSSPVIDFHPSNQHSLKCHENYIQNVASELLFSKEVIKDRGMASLSYQDWDTKVVYDASNVIPQKGMRTILRLRPKQHKLQTEHRRVSCVETFVPSKKLKSKSCINFGNSQWRKHEHNERRDAKERLSKNSAWSTSTEIINGDHTTEEDLMTCKELKNYKVEDLKDIPDECKAGTLLSVFYKIPGYFPPQKQVQDIGGKNKTAETLSIKHYELAPPLRLQDLMNPKVGKYVYATENDFERELYSGVSKIMHQKEPKQKNCIVMDNNSRYEKHVWPSVPKSYRQWMSSDGQADIDRPLRPTKGPLRWVALPTVVGDKSERSPKKSETSAKVFIRSDSRSQDTEPGPLTKMRAKLNIVTEWRSAWLLSASWKDVTLEQLISDLSNVHSSHKISALVTIASSAVSAPQQIAFPKEILSLVSSALREKDDLVRMAAALCQYLILEVSEEARKIMLKSLESGTDADSWAAAQCLALDGNYGHLVIKRILEQMFASTNKEKEEQALYMLRELSNNTHLIHAMLGEALNSGNWGERLMSCKALCVLHGNIGQGVKHKLSHLMWNDWSPGVREAAAKALGKLNQGKEVHHQIRKHLESDSWKSNVEALSLIGVLQIMTAQLFPGFLQSFENDFIAVRRQACKTAGLLQIKDEMVMNCLYDLVQNDPVWKVRAHAIRALGKIGQITPRVTELMLWAVRAKDPGVRIEAYRCVATLHLCDGEVQHALQDRVLLECDELARREVRQTLRALNMAHNDNQEMMSQVKHQLSKLCQKEALFPKVLRMDEYLTSELTALPNTTGWKSEKQEHGLLWDIADKTLLGQSCLSATSATEYQRPDPELQILSSSVRLDGERWWTAIFRSLQRCSIGYRSGLWLGQSRMVTELF
ncbi:HEAT repeat-containing protein 4 isoform X2 [Dendrobates tinctorius]|uniref:HEAT repeat-containing protein 4 isoform X2 n=1 Tax=Dendrobates tinctorius TaxID=92724 RepID=UPI003CC95DAC